MSLLVTVVVMSAIVPTAIAQRRFSPRTGGEHAHALPPEPSELLIGEAGGVEIDFRFGEWVRNPALPAMTFEFRPPMGTAIVDSEPPPK